jgi:hypothetical protein
VGDSIMARIPIPPISDIPDAENIPITTVEILVCVEPAQYSGHFQISGTDLVPGKPVMIQQAVGPYTGKGTLMDEAEMDQVTVTAIVLNPTTIQAYWVCQPFNGPISGYLKFNYFIGQ